MIRLSLFALLCSALCACAQTGHGPFATPELVDPIVTQGGVVGSAAPSVLVVGASLFTEPFFPFATARLQTSPGSVDWSLSAPSVTIVPTVNSGAPSPPPNGVTVAYVSPGVALLTGHSRGSQYAMSVLSVFSYLSADVGCEFRANAGMAFDPGVTLAPATASQADLYATGPATTSGGLNPCNYGTGYTSAAGTAVTFHFPYGATLSNDGLPNIFSFEPASLWRNDFTTIDGGALALASTNVIRFKTAGGRIVKFRIVGIGPSAFVGIYEVSDTNAVFPY